MGGIKKPYSETVFYGAEVGGSRYDAVNAIKGWFEGYLQTVGEEESVAGLTSYEHYVVGAYGIGKTHTLRFAHEELKERNETVAYIPVSVKSPHGAAKVALRLLVSLVRRKNVGYDLLDSLIRKYRRVKPEFPASFFHFLLRIRQAGYRKPAILILESAQPRDPHWFHSPEMKIFKLALSEGDIAVVWEMLEEPKKRESFSNSKLRVEADKQPVWIEPFTLDEARRFICGKHEEVQAPLFCERSKEERRRSVESPPCPKTKECCDLIIRRVGCYPRLLRIVCGEMEDWWRTRKDLGRRPFVDFCFQQKRQKIEAVIDRLICDLKQWQRHLYDELVLWADGKEPDPDSGIYGSLCIRGFAYQDDNGRWMLPEWIRDRVKENGGNSVDPQTLEVVRLVGTLLAPLISSGFQGFTGALAKDLENRVWELVRKVPDAADASERKEIKENPGGHDERVGELLGKVAEKYPRQAEAVVWEKSFRQLLENYSSQQPEVGDQFWLVLRRLLRNRDFFTIPEVKQKLIPALGYHPDMWGPSFDEIINGFVGDIRANRELNKLIKEIHHMKPWLFQ